MIPFRRRRPGTADGQVDLTALRLAAERSRALVEESLEILVVLDEHRRVLAMSRRAREALPDVVEGAAFPDAFLATAGGRAPLEVPYDVDGRREVLVYLSAPGDLAAYQELRDGFTAAVSHELRTPLARLLVLLESAALPGSDPRQLVDQARREVEHVRELIDDVLFLSELDTGRTVVSLGSTRVLPVLDRAAASLSERAGQSGVTLTIDCAPDVELPLRQRMLEVVVTNLAANAISHAGEGATCRLSARFEDGHVVLAARDDGVGVPEEDLERLFERFFRSDRARASRGTGLGLAVVKHITAAAGGTVEARTPPGGGLEIRCAFPATRA
jgi:two-component system phosphate regulon sensor histidine kinase PhoR